MIFFLVTTLRNKEHTGILFESCFTSSIHSFFRSKLWLLNDERVSHSPAAKIPRRSSNASFDSVSPLALLRRNLPPYHASVLAGLSQHQRQSQSLHRQVHLDRCPLVRLVPTSLPLSTLEKEVPPRQFEACTPSGSPH